MKTLIFKSVQLLILVLVVIVFVAAGTEEEFPGLINTVNGLLLQKYETYVVTAGIMSAWLAVLGMMCHRLEHIPDLSSKPAKNRRAI